MSLGIAAVPPLDARGSALERQPARFGFAQPGAFGTEAFEITGGELLPQYRIKALLRAGVNRVVHRLLLRPRVI